MKHYLTHLLLAAALMLGVSGAGFAQTSAPNSDPSAHSQQSLSPNDPSGAAMSGQGKVKSCATANSATSDRSGGTAKSSTASGGPESNPGGSVSGSRC